MAKKIEWVSEGEAARMLGYNNRDWFRRLVKSGKIPVAYTSPSKRNHQYSKESLEMFLLSRSTVSSFNS